jgi:hypothetical protein
MNSSSIATNVFSTEGEGKLIDYVTTASHIHYGLIRKAVMKLA